MVQSKILLLLCSLVLATNLSCQIKGNKQWVNLKDSISVRNFIESVTVCEKLKYVEQNSNLFVSDSGYSRIILENITKETGNVIFLTIGNGGLAETVDRRAANLRDQISEIKEITGCNGRK